MISGCWSSTSQNVCTPQCEAVSAPNSLNNTRFCCCTGDMCNTNVTDKYDPNMYVTPSAAVTPSKCTHRNLDVQINKLKRPADLRSVYT